MLQRILMVALLAGCGGSDTSPSTSDPHCTLDTPLHNRMCRRRYLNAMHAKVPTVTAMLSDDDQVHVFTNPPELCKRLLSDHELMKDFAAALGNVGIVFAECADSSASLQIPRAR